MTAERMVKAGPVVRVHQAHKAFNGQAVLAGLDLDVRACETLSVLGGSGAGKSTLLRMIAGLVKPDRGQIIVFGRDHVRLGERALLPLRRRMGVVFQDGALFDSLTVGDNVAFPLRLHTRVSDAEAGHRVAEVLARVGLSGIESRYPAELSGGMRKRVAVARALILQPELILFDEPTAGLDPGNARLICELIAEIRRDVCETSIVVTHDLGCAFRVSTRVALLHAGTIIEVTPPADFQRSPRPEVQTFLEGALVSATAA